MAARSSRLKRRGTIWLVISNQLKHLNLWEYGVHQRLWNLEITETYLQLLEQHMHQLRHLRSFSGVVLNCSYDYSMAFGKRLWMLNYPDVSSTENIWSITKQKYMNEHPGLLSSWYQIGTKSSSFCESKSGLGHLEIISLLLFSFYAASQLYWNKSCRPPGFLSFCSN